MTAEFEDPYNIPVLQSTLGEQKYEFYYTPETTTTMDMAEEHAKTNGRQPAIFLTDHQTKGIGRGNRAWIDKPGGASILATGLVRIKPAAISVFADMVALHTCRKVQDTTGIRTIRIKYPNDLVIDNQKTGGFLVVNIIDGVRYLATNAGIGVNVHYNEKELAQFQTDYGATALDVHTANPNCRQALLIAIFSGLSYLAVDAEVFQSNRQFQHDQNNLWRDYSSMLERVVQIETDQGILVRGKVVDTQIARGVLVEDSTERKWFNRFNQDMKVRLA